MNDPHVEWLRYRLELGSGLTITNPPALEHDGTDLLKLRLDAGILTVEMKEHHASIESARAAVQPILRGWELDNALNCGPGAFRFVYEDGKVMDRNPPPPGSSQTISVVGRAGGMAIVGGQAMLRHGLREYPPLPSNFVASPDVETLWYRYEMYREGKEPLPHMAYFCLTVLEGYGGSGQGRRGGAGVELAIDPAILNQLGQLVSERGDERTARKRPKGGWQTYDPKELAWIEAVIRAAIRRLGEYAAGARPLKTLTMADFPHLGG